MISNYLTSLSDDVLSGQPQIGEFPSQFNQSWIKVQDMRYGENPHQRAAFYRDIYPAAGSLSAYKQLQGKELSYNNIADADAAWEAVKSFDAPACVIVKHANPCGVAIASNTLDAYKLAYATDTTSAFGGIIAFNREVDGETVKQITDNQFMEVSWRRSLPPKPSKSPPPRKTCAYWKCRLKQAPTALNSNASAADCWCKPPTSTASAAPI